MSMTPAEFTLHDCEVALGNAIRLAREHKGITQAELGARIGADKRAIAQIETGEESPDLGTLAELTMKGLELRFGEVGHFVDQYLGRT
jgi:transcriptional regulator with XRE-family HTH domain